MQCVEVVDHDYRDLIRIFEQTFYDQYRTRLVKGEDEPIYLPADEKSSDHRIVFAHGFYASALHEIAHWLIAGAARRQLVDYGYWYQADGRDQASQNSFEAAEIKPQAIEWSLSVAAGFAFNVSCDNLSGVQPDRFAFQARVQQQVALFLRDGYPPRVQQLLTALSQFYHTKLPTELSQFSYQQPELAY